MTQSTKPALLALEDGTLWPGIGFGAQGDTTGEVVFNTSMTGYQEILTDPSYDGQIVTMTAPQIGNVGVNLEDEESKTYLVGRIRCSRTQPNGQQLPCAKIAGRIPEVSRDCGHQRREHTSAGDAHPHGRRHAPPRFHLPTQTPSVW